MVLDSGVYPHLRADARSCDSNGDPMSKGSKPRPITDRAQFDSNWDVIFKKKEQDIEVSMLEWTIRNKKMLQHLKDTNPTDLQELKEEGYEVVWNLNKTNSPFHAEGFSKTRHDDEKDG